MKALDRVNRIKNTYNLIELALEFGNQISRGALDRAVERGNRKLSKKIADALIGALYGPPTEARVRSKKPATIKVVAERADEVQ